MIPNKVRESRRVKSLKLPKNLERLYKEGKCRECSVVVTRMDFAKILGKFTKVKIQYESSTTPKTKQNVDSTLPNSNAKLKNTENGMVLVHRKTCSQPEKEVLNSKKTKNSKLTSPIATNILKENNRLKKPVLKDKNSNYEDKKQKSNNNLKQYSIVFEDPLCNNNNNNEINFKISLIDLLPDIDDSILPSEEWCIDSFPKKDEPKDDQVYDRIAAELEDLMYNEKPIVKLEEKPDVPESKVDDFPSIMDILNDNSSESKSTDQSNTLEFKTNLESSDVEAMLLGKPNASCETIPKPMDVDNTSMGNLIEDVNQLNTIQETLTSNEEALNSEGTLHNSVMPEQVDNPHSPSILDEALQKGIEEHLPVKHDEPNLENEVTEDKTTVEVTENLNSNSAIDIEMKDTETKVTDDIEDKNQSTDKVKSKETNFLSLKDEITHIVFKKSKEGVCSKSVTCPKNLKYCIEISEKSVEFLGAPKYITSLEDLKVLLQIVNESELDSPYVLH
ncbi:unnamed protein product [Spodoptera exigua]|uniref:Uncharacterized protein n=1 Tax=Spodoptera exigua TaxID=7107 RepID=A0A922MT65_SPOEX|nr:hypothetical protein HF086_005531 [Spodoptera exigua]CAH0686143.1 unnamed protein product [Spodoptera exigua]